MQTYICINTHVKRHMRIVYVYMYVHTCETLCACQTGHRLYLGISKPHENTQTVSICMSRHWRRQGVIESFPDPVLGGNQWDGMECFKVNLNNWETWR